MHDRGRPIERGVEFVRVEDVADHEGGADSVEVRLEPGGEIVERDDLIDGVVGEQHPAQVRPDDSGSAGDNDFHAGVLRCRGRP